MGVGEHSKISVEIKNRLEELAQVDDVVNTIEKHFDVKPAITEPNEDQTGE